MPVNSNNSRAPHISPWTVTNSGEFANDSIYTELVNSMLPITNVSDLSNLFPNNFINATHIEVVQQLTSQQTLTPVVDSTKPGVFTGLRGQGTRKRYISPIYLRDAKALSHLELANMTVASPDPQSAGSVEAKVTEILEQMVGSMNLTWDVFRARILLGSINYTDPRTGVTVDVDAHIPAHNIWRYDRQEGFKGRQDAAIFTRLQDSNAIDPVNIGVGWADPNADIISTVHHYNAYHRYTNKTRITDMFMSPELNEVIKMNNQVRLAMGGTAFNLPIRGQSISRDNPDPIYMSSFAMNTDGTLASIGGVPISIVNTQYIDPVQGVQRQEFPIDKVVMVSQVDANNREEAVGVTQYCLGEEVNGTPGIWVRVQDETVAPNAPGITIMMGNAGIPYLKYPYKVGHLTVSSVQDLRSRMRVQGDLQYGIL